MRFILSTGVSVGALAALTLSVPGTAAAASSPAVSASSAPGSITVEFDFAGVDVNSGVTCVTYVSTQQNGLDAVDPSGRADAQSPGSKFAIENTSTSAMTYAEDGKPVSVAPQPITAGTYFVYWGCRDAANTQWDNVGLDSGTPFANPIVVEVSDDGTSSDSVPGGQSPAPGATAPQPNGIDPGAFSAIDTPEELVDAVVDFFRDALPN